MQWRTGLGSVELSLWCGQDPADRHWGCPLAERWGMGPHQKLTPALAEKLCFTVTATASYADAAAVAGKWGCSIDDSTLHSLVQRMGTAAEAEIQQRLKSAPPEAEPRRKPSELAVILVDGWLARFRGPGWGRPKSQKSHVEWREMKTGVFYLHEQASRSDAGRGLLSEKVIVSWQGEPGELGRRLHWEGQWRGLGRAKQTLVLGDGAPWIWKLKEDRWASAHELLDFYHASQHLWQLGEALNGEANAARWVEPRRHQLRHGQQAQLLGQIARLKRPRGQAAEVVAREQGYFAEHAGRMEYQKLARRGWPIGSGAVESACRQQQCRFKRPGQFWTQKGLRHLCALTEASRNAHWQQLWNLV